MNSERDGAGVGVAPRQRLHGILYASEEHYGEAEAACLRAIELDPEMMAPYVALASTYARTEEYRKMVGVLRRARGVNPQALRACLDGEPQGKSRSEGSPRKKVNVPKGVEGAAEISHALVGVAMSRIVTMEDKEAVLAAETALQLDPKNSPAVMLLTLAYLLWGRGGEVRGRTSVLRNIPGLAEELFGR